LLRKRLSGDKTSSITNHLYENSLIRGARESGENQVSEEFLAVDVQMAMDHLGGIVGKNFDEDLLDQIFGEFCIGK
jgi:tRNA U34 5-carboxymethylaminomethyl modifying GTPase MnmE/TrmE